MPFIDWILVHAKAARAVFFAAILLAVIISGLAYFTGPEFFHFDAVEVRRLALRLLTAAVIFGSVVYATRLMQTILRTGILATGRVDQGIAYSLEKAIGYGGLSFAALYSASVAGLDLSGVTIVAGALSVGVGFGLQTVISNFVCGLIVLVERPIKLGDWVVVKDFEGIVRRINVRSTEIETFNKASVLIPNSEFITGTVTNWTHGNTLGRVEVKVRAPLTSDANEVIQVLRETVRRHPLLLDRPSADASLDNIGPEALEFSVGGFVADITQGGRVRSDLRLMVLDAFRKSGIDMPLPQRQIQVRQAADGEHVPISYRASRTLS
jgi:small-conductance mechanosensitive channel